MAYENRFRNPESAQQYLTAYEKALALWPSPPEAVQVETRFGITHINSAGSPTSPPIILIHGAQTSSTVWHPNIAALSQHFRVYAPDVIDQSGKSMPTRKLLNRRNLADWLTDVLDGLKLERAAFVGHSHGGWQVLNLAIMKPERVERMVLLSPAGLSRLRVETFLRLIPVFIIPTKKMFYWGFQWSTTKPLDIQKPDPVIDQIMAGGRAFKPQELSLGVVQVFDDAELRQLNQPTLLLVGDQEKVFNHSLMIERAQRLMPHIETNIIPNAAHLLSIDQAEMVNQRMVSFLKPSPSA